MKTHPEIRLGLVDSGVADDQKQQVVGGCRFTVAGRTAVIADPLGHGTAICAIIGSHAPDVRLYNAQVFDHSGVTTAAIVAAAIDWLVDEKVNVINLSLGLRQNRPVLAAACAQAQAAGIIMIASAPAQGAPTYPSAYPGVIRATGDARCGPGEISFLHNRQADFGACPQAVNISENRRPGGASMGAAHISGQIAACLQTGKDKNAIWHWLVSRAKYSHREYRIQ